MKLHIHTSYQVLQSTDNSEKYHTASVYYYALYILCVATYSACVSLHWRNQEQIAYAT